MLFCCSGVCSGVVCHINGGAVTSITCPDVQSTEDCWDLLLQHGTYPTAVVSDLAGHWRAFQQGMSLVLLCPSVFWSRAVYTLTTVLQFFFLTVQVKNEISILYSAIKVEMWWCLQCLWRLVGVVFQKLLTVLLTCTDKPSVISYLSLSAFCCAIISDILELNVK